MAGDAQKATRPAKGRSGVVVPEQPKWHGRLAARLIWLLIHALGLTLRWHQEDKSDLFPLGIRQRMIFAVWHNRLALCLLLYRRYVKRHQANRQLAAITSASRDGGLLARVLELFEVQPVRGSSSRRGAAALRELTSAAEQGYDLAVTPDGPRGPCYVVQPGVIAAAQLTGLPVMPVCYSLSWKKTLRSWDRFQIPLPFTRVVVIFGKPLYVPPEADEVERERLRVELERRLLELTLD
jgi:lysophospholipid acyltransferase (LPLAT)-like uncharacterized protein